MKYRIIGRIYGDLKSAKKNYEWLQKKGVEVDLIEIDYGRYTHLYFESDDRNRTERGLEYFKKLHGYDHVFLQILPDKK